MYTRPPLLAVLCGLAVVLWDAINRYLAVRFNGQLLLAGLLGAAALALIITTSGLLSHNHSIPAIAKGPWQPAL
jgi:hypothetical protein